MKYTLLSIMACTSLTCVGGSYEKLTHEKQLHEQSAMIKVTIPEHSNLHYKFAFKFLSSKKILACLIADQNQDKAERTAAQLLEELAPLKLPVHLVPNHPVRSASRRRTIQRLISGANEYKNIAYIVVFISKDFGPCMQPLPRVEVDAVTAPIGTTLWDCSSNNSRSLYEYTGAGEKTPELSFEINNSAIDLF